MKRQSRLLAECTAPEVRAQIDRSPKVIVPAGATEQHGPHAPMGTDAILATEVGLRIAARIDGLVAPALPYGVSGDHRGFPVVYLSVPVLTGLIQDVCRSLAETGFREIVIVNGHYTNMLALSGAVAELEGLPDGTIVFPFSYWEPLPTDQLNDYLSADAGLHANIGETSAVMAVDESLVDLDHAVAEYPAFPVPPTAPVVAAFFFSGRGTTFRATRSGTWGDPRGSTADRGRRYLDQIEESAVKFVHEVEKVFEQFSVSAGAAQTGA